MKFTKIFTLVAFQLAAFFPNAYAGPHSDELARCLIESTSERDRNGLIVWMFSAASQHPAVKDIVNVTPQQLDDANKNYAELTVRLLTEDCLSEAKKAVKYEGEAALENSFNLFGQAAGRELFSSPYVAGAMAGYVKHIDRSKLQKLK